MRRDAILSLQSLSLQIADKRLCSQLSLSLQAGTSLGILGRNGTGKTTLLHALVRLHKPHSGHIRLADKPLEQWSQRELACLAGILFQHNLDAMPISVGELVLMGRHPHHTSFWNDSTEDKEAASAALTAMGMNDFARRQLSTLSGGERQRVALAMLLCQNPRLYLLDEPSNHLDIAFQIRSLEIFQQKIRDNGAALCMATHDINLAARFCDTVLLLLGDGHSLYGQTEQVLTETNLAKAYDCEIRKVSDGSGRNYFFPA
ncbi:MAG: ABC transporter ATP-binding protein [Pseudomonadales bacterium]|nr:ABC transporter ATP-binding protein [Pseudomonadales bacterium]